MTIKDLANISGIKEKTVRQRIHSVVGVTESEDGTFNIPDGSRYPYDTHRYKFDNIGKRRRALLEATFCYRYVDHVSLCMPEESFKTMLEELLNVGLIQKNGINNPYGANGFDTTMKYEDLRSEKPHNIIKAIGDLIGSATGHFAGAMLNELYP